MSSTNRRLHKRTQNLSVCLSNVFQRIVLLGWCPKARCKEGNREKRVAGEGREKYDRTTEAGSVRQLHGTLAGAHTVGDELSFGVLAARSVCGDEGGEMKHTKAKMNIPTQKQKGSAIVPLGTDSDGALLPPQTPSAPPEEEELSAGSPDSSRHTIVVSSHMPPEYEEELRATIRQSRYPLLHPVMLVEWVLLFFAMAYFLYHTLLA